MAPAPGGHPSARGRNFLNKFNDKVEIYLFEWEKLGNFADELMPCPAAGYGEKM